MTSRPLSAIAALLGFSGVALGAFGAHGLQGLVAPAMIEVWKTAVLYQLFHTPVILLVAMLPWFAESASARVAVWSFVAGTLLFSGSLYLLVALDIAGIGMVTPLGGALLLVGWLALLVAILGKQNH